MNNVLVTITGPSGSGKSTLERMLKERYGYLPLVSVTTRNMREGEVNGQNYYFLTPEGFADLAAADKLVENITFNGNSYGMPKFEVDKIAALPSPGVFVCDPHGREQIEAYAKTIGLQVFRVFVDVQPGKQMDRLLRRFLQDVNAVGSETTVENMARFDKVMTAHSKRFVEVMTTERGWVANAHADIKEDWERYLRDDGKSGNPKYRSYDILFNHFDADNQDFVLDSLDKTVRSLIRDSVKRAA